MLSKVLVPLDGSTLAERALPVAANLARRLSAGIVLVHSIGLSGPSSPERYLDHVRSGLLLAGLRIQTAILDGEAAAEILSAAHIYGADMIVMTRHGRSEVGRWLIGSVSAGVVRGASVPVVLVPSRAEPMTPPGERPTILLPLDGSLESESAIATGATMTAELGAQLVLFRAVPEQDSDARLWLARHYLTDIARKITTTVPRLAVRVGVGTPAASIGQAVLEAGADFVLMASRGASDPERVVVGTVATSVLRTINLPVVLVRPTTAIKSGEIAAAEPSDDDPPDPANPAGGNPARLTDCVAV